MDRNRTRIDAGELINKYDDMFSEAQNLSAGLGKAIADFITAHDPIARSLRKDFKRIGQIHSAAEKHKDKRMLSVTTSILNLLYKECSNQKSDFNLQTFLYELRIVLGTETFDKILSDKRSVLPSQLLIESE